ncbi:thiamine phosphate synthase [Haloplasma contractile]|uniref:Thiamine-phosphate synthase n=1 Tax=Haloplasma contractile SSD-17B TaxID=1033810 RepID=U2DTR3_9MOLU|nr:thiamine phosphate synthase [Haloplasma contractile]ERJ11857.1 Thiamine-phosphate synthase protein [Haloplasma contractile SSD-17B]
MKSNKNINFGLYLVTDRDVLNGRDLISSLADAIKGGVSVVQLREKHTASRDFYDIALAVRELTARYDIPLIINDRLDIAQAIGADGVHLGQSDLPAQVAREILGKNQLVGVSTATVEEAVQAESDGADYIGVGALFKTGTKSNTRQVTPELLKEIKGSVEIPVVAIGGINHSNVEELDGTSVDGIAVVSAILGKEDIKQAAKSLHAKFQDIN